MGRYWRQIHYMQLYQYIHLQYYESLQLLVLPSTVYHVVVGFDYMTSVDSVTQKVMTSCFIIAKSKLV